MKNMCWVYDEEYGCVNQIVYLETGFQVIFNLLYILSYILSNIPSR